MTTVQVIALINFAIIVVSFIGYTYFLTKEKK